MKTLLVTLALAAATLQAAHAYGFRANARVYMDRTQATVEVYNQLPQPIHCRGQVRGITMSGNYAFANVNITLYPGQWANAYVYTSSYDPFRHVQPQITCQTL